MTLGREGGCFSRKEKMQSIANKTIPLIAFLFRKGYIIINDLSFERLYSILLNAIEPPVGCSQFIEWHLYYLPVVSHKSIDLAFYIGGLGIDSSR